MTYLTKEEYTELFEDGVITAYNDLLEKCREFVETEYLPEYSGFKRAYIEDIWIDEEDGSFGTIHVDICGTHCGCCYDDYDSITIPLSYMWDGNNWRKIEEEKQQFRKQQAEYEREQRRKAEEKRLKEQRYLTYLRLKEEFGDVE
jgi:hypothetical protein